MIKTLTDKYMHIVFTLYSLVVFGGYVDLQIEVRSLQDYRIQHEQEYKEHKKAFIWVKEEQIARKNVITFIKRYRNSTNWDMFNHSKN